MVEEGVERCPFCIVPCGYAYCPYTSPKNEESKDTDSEDIQE